MRVAPGFLELYPPPVIFDEVQYAPDLLPYIKEKADADRARNCQYLLTDSQNLLLAEGGNGGGLRGRDHRKARSHRGEAVGYAAAGNGRSHQDLPTRHGNHGTVRIRSASRRYTPASRPWCDRPTLR